MILSPCCKAELSLGPLSGASICCACGQPAYSGPEMSADPVPEQSKAAPRYTLTSGSLDWAAAMCDARTLNWYDVGDMPPADEPFYVAWQVGTEWQVWRVPAGQPLPPLATHWHRDSMGLPVA